MTTLIFRLFAIVSKMAERTIVFDIIEIWFYLALLYKCRLAECHRNFRKISF